MRTLEQKKLDQYKANRKYILSLSPEQKQKNRDTSRAYQAKYYATRGSEHRSTAEYKAKARERQKKRNSTAEGKAKIRARRLRREYNLTPEQWQEMFEAQGSCCAICKSREPGSPKGWSTDHCHVSDSVRGILCPLCNKALGLFKDNIPSLTAAISYLLTHSIGAN